MTRSKLSKSMEYKIRKAERDIWALDYSDNILYRACRRIYQKIYNKNAKKTNNKRKN